MIKTNDNNTLSRIKRNEDLLDETLISISDLEKSLDNFKSNIKNIKLLNKYYGSRLRFKDKEMIENGSITNVKAGVLSEDTIWNMDEDIRFLIDEMN